MPNRKIALINDLSGFGRCSLNISLPVLSAMGFWCAVLPTALLSNHTGYESFTFYDFTPHIPEYINKWRDRGISFDGIYTGFLGSEAQIELMEGFLKTFGRSALKIIDPVMGENGKAYATFTPMMLEKMGVLAQYADVLTPNLTELMILLEQPYPKSITLKELTALCRRLSEANRCRVVLTGISHDVCSEICENRLGNLCVSGNQTAKLIDRPRSRTAFAGTGDLFASVLCGEMLRGKDFITATEKAADFVSLCALSTEAENGAAQDGPAFENHIKELLTL